MTKEQFDLEITECVRYVENKRRKTLESNHRAIIESLKKGRYFQWHNSLEKIELDFKWQAWSIFHFTRSKKTRALCLKQIEYYDSQFGTTGFETLIKKAV